ncbi:MAG: lipoate--protein ligase [Bacteroidales bacterium]|nr:lipoate--protein ligase [Bacteroidales bacterium]
MRYLTNPCTDPHRNMAFDEFCLEQLPLEEPVFYLWRNRPSVIIGLNQNAYGEVNLPFLEEKGIILARRVTGGGAVYHDLQNLNYTIVGRSGDLERDYPGYLHLFCDALRQLGVPALLSGRNDILVDGCKVSGYAKRVWHDRLMVHGTLMYDVDLDTLTQALSVPGSKYAGGGRTEASGIASVHARVANLKDFLPQFASLDEVQAALQDILAASDSEYCLDEAQQAEIDRIAREKFATREWNLGRSPLTTFRRSGRFSCGTVEVSFTVTRGVLTEVEFGGDFLGNQPADELAAVLKGCPYEPDALAARLAPHNISRYFDGLTDGELTGLFFHQ